MKPQPIPIDLSHIPGARVTWNTLYDSRDPAYVDQDLVQVELTNGVVVDAGFYGKAGATTPEAYWGKGRFVVHVFRDEDWENPVESVGTMDPREVVPIIERLAIRYSQ